MKRSTARVLTASICLWGVVRCAAQPAPPPSQQASAPADIAAASIPIPAPQIRFSEPNVDFGKIKSGEVVKHTFVFTNTGNSILEIASVQPSCGCTTAGEWSKRVEPGQTGTLAIQFNSANFNGPVMKTVSVTSNDKTQPVTVLQLKGTIWKPIDVAPSFAVLNIPPDAPSGSTVVTITNNMDEAVEVFAPFSNNRSITAELRTNYPGRGYQVVVKASQPLAPGNVQAQVSLKTSSTNMPQVLITVWANVQAAVMVMPPQITLPPPPLQAKTMPSITVQNYSTNALQLSDAQLDLEGVTVSLQEIQPGRTFSATMAFPQGFELPKGKSATLTVKTSNPQFPLVKVPIHQLPKTAAPPTVPTPTVSATPTVATPQSAAH